jgi:uncharacterized membrane protein YtjA (UPF0391 family)
MLRWAFIFLLISLVADGLGRTGLAAGAGRTSKLLPIVVSVLFLLAVLALCLVGDIFT